MSGVWIDGALTDESAAHISPLGAGTLTGLGVFESMKVLRGGAFALRRHLRRLHSSAAIVGLEVPYDDATLHDAVAAVLAGRDDATRLRVTVTAGPTDATSPSVIVHAVAIAPWAPESNVIVSPWARNERSPSVGAKTTSYVDNVLALRHARSLGADEAIICDTRGHLSEGSASNLFLVRDGVLCTPALSTGCLAGMTRELLVELVDVTECDALSLDDLWGADEVFLTSSTRDVHPVATVDGEAVRTVRGPVTSRAADAFAALQARTLDP